MFVLECNGCGGIFRNVEDAVDHVEANPLCEGEPYQIVWGQ